MSVKTEFKPLKLDLQFFAEDDSTNNDGTNADNTSDATQNTGNNGVNNKDTSASTQDNKQQEHMIPKSRFDEINTKFKETQTQLQQILNERQEQEKKAKEEQGKFEELYKTTSEDLTKFKSQYEQTEGRAKELEGVINGLLESRLQSIDEQFHDLIPDNLTPEQKLSWIDRAEGKGIFGKKENDQPVGEGTNPSNAQAADVSTLSAFQLMKAGYGSK